VARDLRGAVVVVTGASSGIGRAAASALAREGARLALAARAEPTLHEVGDACARLGAEVLTVVTDVRDEAAVEALATRTEERFGRIDVWVNNAAVMAYGRFEDIPSEVFRAVIETNVLGMTHGARAALPRFRRRQSGTLINMASVWGRVTSPDVSAYVTSKFAVRAFGDCLREELADAPGIDVVTILPQAVDTPIFAQAANYSGRTVRPIPPLFDPDEVAQGIVSCARSPRREVTYGRLGRLLEVLYATTPRLYDRVFAPGFAGGSFASAPAEPSRGNLLSPRPASERVYGGWRRSRRRELAGALAATVAGGLRGLLRGTRAARASSKG
jgi:NAD(P)-dependent dehydrogenase (short-subunit alcohol dehydrogenase family)